MAGKRINGEADFIVGLVRL